MFAKPLIIRRHFVGSLVALLLSISPTFPDSPLAGGTALQRVSGRTFKLKCSDGLQGYGRFESRSSVWAAFKLSKDAADALPRRASARIRVNGKEVCFLIDGLDFAGETCAPVIEKSAGIFRFGDKTDWCDVLLIPNLPAAYSAFATP
jgi:hypothetical protein